MWDICFYHPWPNLVPKYQQQLWGVLWHCVGLQPTWYLLKWAWLGLNIFPTSMRRGLLHQTNNMVMQDILLYPPWPNLAQKCWQQLWLWGVLWHCVGLHPIGYLLKCVWLCLHFFPTSMRRVLLHRRNNVVTWDIYDYYSGPNLAQKCHPQSWEVLCYCVDLHPIEYLLK